eukprot:TRINITY_DN37688_c0_g1_i1.p1 TRINITY_DN37688_c0_g1~~TRINITY_DN37688_c0_g1_i1.p1  ORF type:complete len:556 (+),score=39.75 TRINITY_DN37688_c0_g1_i1:141-1808(+)
MWRSRVRSIFQRAASSFSASSTSSPGANTFYATRTAEAFPIKQVLTPAASFSRLLSSQSAYEEPFHSNIQGENSIFTEEHENLNSLNQKAPKSQDFAGYEHSINDDFEKIVSLLKRNVGAKALERELESLGFSRIRCLEDRILDAVGLNGRQIVSFFRWLVRQPEYAPRLRTIHKIIKSVYSNGGVKWQVIRDFLDEIAVLHEGLVKRSDLNFLIRCLGQSENPKDAIQVLRNFQKYKCEPAAISYVIAMEELCKFFLYSEAWNLLEEMEKAGLFLEDQDCKRFIKHLCGCGRTMEAYNLYLKMIERGMFPSLLSIYTLAESLCSVEGGTYIALDLARSVLKDSKYSNIAFRDGSSSKILRSIIRSLCLKDVDEALSFLSEIADTGIPHSESRYNVVITFLCRANREEEALGLIEDMRKRKLIPYIKSYNAILKSYVKQNKMEEACQVFAKARTLHHALKPESFYMLIIGYYKLEDLKKAHDYILELRKAGHPPRRYLYRLLIRAYCLRHADWRAAENLLIEMENQGLRPGESTKKLVLALKELENEVLQDKSSI